MARVRAAAAVHDVGKLRTTKAILNKPGRLTDAEFEVIKRHPVDGAEMVAAPGDPELTRIVRHHHERLDGAGYPGGLYGDEIPLGARIIAVADTFDAITSARPYRDAAPHQNAIDILRKEAGTQLDPDAVRAFLAYYSGRRPMVMWAIITSSLRRLVAWLSGDPAAAATVSGGKLAAATAATAAIGAAAGVAPVPVVHHHPSRPAIAHGHVRTIPARMRGEAVGLHRHGMSVLVQAHSRAAAPRSAHAAKTPKATKAAKPTAAPRRGVPGAAPNRPRAKPSGGKPAQILTAGTGAGAGTQATAGASTGSGIGKPPATATGQSPGTTTGQSTNTTAGQSTNTTSGQSTSTTAGQTTSGPVVSSTPQPSAPAPGSHWQGSNQHGNAYGHTKPLGNGHGNGLADGHGTPQPNPSSHHAPPTPAPAFTPAPASTTPPPPPATAPSRGGQNGAGQVTPPTPSDGWSQDGQDEHGDHGGGGGQGNGRGRG